MLYVLHTYVQKGKFSNRSVQFFLTSLRRWSASKYSSGVNHNAQKCLLCLDREVEIQQALRYCCVLATSALD